MNTAHESHELPHVITQLQHVGEGLFDASVTLRGQQASEPKLEAIPIEDIKNRAKAELTGRMQATYADMRQNSADSAWEHAGTLSATLFNQRQNSPELEAEEATLAILEDALGTDSEVYIETKEALEHKKQSLQPSDLEVELNVSIEHYGRAVAIPSLAIRGLQAVVAPETTEQQEVTLTEVIDQLEAAEEDTREVVVTSSTETESTAQRSKMQHKRGSMVPKIVEFVAANNGKVTREQLMDYLDGLVEDPTLYNADRSSRYGAHVTQLLRKADRLGLEVISTGNKKGEPYTLTIRHASPEVQLPQALSEEQDDVQELVIETTAHAVDETAPEATPEPTQVAMLETETTDTETTGFDVQEVYSRYATLHSERDIEVQGSISIVMLSEAILGVLKDPQTWSQGKEDQYFPNEADKSVLIGFINEAYEQIPQELTPEERRAYAARVILHEINQNPHWIEAEFEKYDRANKTGEYSPILNSLAIMLKLQDMSDAEREDFVGQQLAAQPYMRIGAVVSSRTAIIEEVSHLPKRDAISIPTVPIEDAEFAEQETVPVVTPEHSHEDITATAVAAHIEVVPMPEGAIPEKKKGLFSKKTAIERAEERLEKEGIKAKIGEAIDRLDVVGLMTVSPDGKALTMVTAQSMMRAMPSNKFLSKETIEKLRNAGIISQNDLTNLDAEISRATMILSMVFSSFEVRLNQKQFAAAACKIIDKCIAEYDAKRQVQ